MNSINSSLDSSRERLPEGRTSRRRLWQAGLLGLTVAASIAGVLPVAAKGGKVPAAPPVANATASIVATGLSTPAGMVWLGDATTGHLWVSDGLAGFCRIDGSVLSAVCFTEAVKPGQPSYDASSGTVYLPDSSSKSAGVYLLHFDAATNTLSKLGTVQAAGLGALRPSATAVDGGGSLYVGTVRGAGIYKITDPSSALLPAPVGTTSGKGVVGLAFSGSDLYVAEKAAVTKLAGGAGAAQPSGITAAAPTAIAADGANVYVIDTPAPVVAPAPPAAPAGASDVLRYNTATNTQTLLANAVTTTTVTVDAKGRVRTKVTTTKFTGGSALAVDPLHNLYVGDDPNAGAAVAPAVPAGNVYKIPA